MTALAIAASLVAVVTLGVLLRSSRPAAPTVAVARVVHDTVHVVRFVFVGDAKTVSLVGDFNAWGAEHTPLTASGANGSWAVSVPLSRGRHEYAFIVDGKRWVADPYAPATTDEFNTSSSIVTVGT
jgi:1,4-alpha-glucan branching enzyme